MPVPKLTGPAVPFSDGQRRKGRAMTDTISQLACPGEYQISTDRSRLDLARIHAFLSESYWSPGIPVGVVQAAIENSICFGVYRASEQVGFARVITDRATFAYLADVFILPAWRGRGLGARLIDAIMRHEDLQGLRRFMLATRDAHDLYRRFGFETPAQPGRLMEILNARPYGGI
jgi:GNAT superfamily N-acetyltransferase